MTKLDDETINGMSVPEMTATAKEALDDIEAKAGIAFRIAADANGWSVASMLAVLSKAGVITVEQGKALSSIGAEAFVDHYISEAQAYAVRKVQ